jgi:teichuronic acid biosynthesis glycosyltransferase TuaC
VASSHKSLQVLTYTTLFPNEEMPRHGIFVAERLRHLLATGKVDSTIMAPVPWFPWTSSQFGSYGVVARVPAEEMFEGNRVIHPRYPLIPKVGMTVAPALLAAASYLAVRREFGNLDAFDLIDAHYIYPDGVAAALLGRWFDKPVIITGRGSDVNLIPQYRLARRQILWAARTANELVTVSDALGRRLVELGAQREKISVLRNGVDLKKFRPLDRDSVRKELHLTRKTLLSVGNLVELKGHHLAIESLAELRETELVIIGSGPLEDHLRRVAHARRVGDRVRFVGTMNQEELVRYYNGADCLVLCSSREGMANVLLESLACGTPVVATPVGGNAEVIRDEVAGVLMQERSTEALVNAVRRLFAGDLERERTRDYAKMLDWSETTNGTLQLFEKYRQR